MELSYLQTVAESVVREFLSRKGLKRTLSMMEEECPRKAGSISKRVELSQALYIEDLFQENKKSTSPLRTLLEIIVWKLITGQPNNEASPTTATDELQELTLTDIEGSGSYGASHHGNSNHCNDLVLDDDIDDGETFVGDGKAGLFGKGKPRAPESTLTFGARPTAGPPGGRNLRPRSRGISSGPITSSLDDREKQRMQRMKTPRGFDGRSPTVASDTPLFLLDEPKTAELPFKDTSARVKVTEVKQQQQQPSSPEKAKNSRRLLGSMDSKDRLESILSADVNSRLENVSRLSQRSTNEQPITDEHIPAQPSIAKDTRKNPTLGASKPAKKEISATSKPSKHKSALDDLELGDVDDLDEEVNNLQIDSRIPLREPSFFVDSKPIDIETAIELKTLVLGSAQLAFNDEWKYQSFTFCDLPKLRYGFVQKKGGPCGVLASVQACLLQEILFRDSSNKPTSKSLDLNRNQRSEFLAKALATILWRCGDGSSAVVALPGRKVHFPRSNKIKGDNMIETLMINTLYKKEELQSYLHQNIGQFELDGSSGVILALYSAVLSRTIQRVRSDMDEPTGTLMGAHGYCTQDLVSLLMTGRAASNVFNDTVELDGGTTLRGIHGRADVGLLSLFEHYRSCQVGTYLKTPRCPVWVVCSESHFSVLFCLRMELLRDWKAEKRFDLYYYDGLGRQDHEIRLSIDTTNRFYQAPEDGDLVPPLEHCIRTKWSDAEIDWNGTDPLL